MHCFPPHLTLAVLTRSEIGFRITPDSVGLDSDEQDVVGLCSEGFEDFGPVFEGFGPVVGLSSAVFEGFGALSVLVCRRGCATGGGLHASLPSPSNAHRIQSSDSFSRPPIGLSNNPQ